MRADIHDGPEHMLQSETEYIDARRHQPASTKASCTARPDHTFGSLSTVSPGFACYLMSALPQKQPVPGPCHKPREGRRSVTLFATVRQPLPNGAGAGWPRKP